MSNLKLAAEPKSYAEAEAFLDGEMRKSLGYKTTIEEGDSGIEIIHHNTAIVIFHADGSMTLDNGGYHSSTTTNRIHKFTPRHIRANIIKGWMHVTLNDGEPVELLRSHHFTADEVAG